MPHLHIAIGSTTSRPGEVAQNLRQIADFAGRAAADGADLLLTPEMSASGYGAYPEVLATAETAGNGPIFAELAAIAARHRLVICAGFVEADQKKRYISHYAVYPNREYIVQRKHRVTLTEKPLDSPVRLSGHPPGADDPADPGQPLDPPVFAEIEIKGVRCLMLICADYGIETVHETLNRRAVQLLLLPTGAGGKREDRVVSADLATAAGREHYVELLETLFFPKQAVADCLKYRRALAAVNLGGWDGRRYYHAGHGMIITPLGEVPGFFHGIPNLDRQRPMYAHALVEVDRTPGKT